MSEPWVVLGEIVKPHGLRGEVKVRSEIVDPDNFLLPGLCLRFADGRLQAAPVAAWREQKKGYLLRFADFDRFDQVEKLAGCELVLRGDQLPAPAVDEFYHYQLLGLKVFDYRGRALGVLSEIIATAGHDVVEIRAAEAQNPALLLPLVSAYVLAVDLKAGRVTVDPEGGGGVRGAHAD